MVATQSTLSYQKNHPTSRKAVLRAVYEVFGTLEAMKAANGLLRAPVQYQTLCTWRWRWSLHNAMRRQP